ncbi:hypothetical protein [Actinacidiphila sp. ITFR-21]|uniref:hypothetical protein n=1 Tax=Actinacidiphila sp. ITFR-21 TaxID=3075199 RepID=UPI00288B488A|nr:hypothetical protein [Streptomyces sp. ITFR-21]WNI19209.1 hypothetical protein RLT57_29140 [Streptomyces sp. ITFR-21]
MTTATPAPVEFLYGIDSSVDDDSTRYRSPHVVQFRITKKTPKRIYYVASRDWDRHPRIRFVDRHRIEADGEIYRRSAGWWETDNHLYLNPPELRQPAKPDLPALKAAMAAAHPDRGGSDAEFINARQQYETARNREAS